MIERIERAQVRRGEMEGNPRRVREDVEADEPTAKAFRERVVYEHVGIEKNYRVEFFENATIDSIFKNFFYFKSDYIEDFFFNNHYVFVYRPV